MLDARRISSSRSAQFAIGDDQKVAASAGGIEKIQPPQFLVKFQQPVFVVFDFFKLFPKPSRKSDDEFENVFLAEP